MNKCVLRLVPRPYHSENETSGVVVKIHIALHTSTENTVDLLDRTVCSASSKRASEVGFHEGSQLNHPLKEEVTD